MSGARPANDQACTPSGRIPEIDLLRSLALIGMVVFHFARDLEVFGLIPPGTTLNGGWAAFARVVAGAFIFLSGFSFILAHGPQLRPSAWARRTATIAAAALLVSAATYIAFPSRFVYFGILHAIAAFVLVAPLLLRLPAWALAAATSCILLLNFQFGREVFESPWLAWTGLGMQVRPSLDFIPVFPWAAAFLAGMALAKSAGQMLPRLRVKMGVSRLLAWPGRHSLSVYLIHQPILLGMIWVWSRLVASG